MGSLRVHKNRRDRTGWFLPQIGCTAAVCSLDADGLFPQVVSRSGRRQCCKWCLGLEVPEVREENRNVCKRQDRKILRTRVVEPTQRAPAIRNRFLASR